MSKIHIIYQTYRRKKPFERLPDKERAVLVLYVAGFTIRQMATLLKCSVGAIFGYLRKGILEYYDDMHWIGKYR